MSADPRDTALTVIVGRENLPELLTRCECTAFRLVAQPDGSYFLGIERDSSVHGEPPAHAIGLTEGGLDSLRERVR